MFTDNYHSLVALTEFLLKKAHMSQAHLKKIQNEIQKGEMVWRVKEDVVVCK